MRNHGVYSEIRKGTVPIRLGFVPLIDAAPLIVADRLGFFSAQGLAVTLERQIGWANLRDKLTFGRLDAAHGLLGMPLFSVLGRDQFSEPLVTLLNLSSGLDAITVSSRISTDFTTFARLRGRLNRPVLAHVFPCSVHHYLLRTWLAQSGLDPDKDVLLCVLPPLQVASHLSSGYLHGFCVGEPYNTMAERTGAGRIAMLTSDLALNHPDKILLATRRWTTDQPEAASALIRATAAGVEFCANPANTAEVAKILSEERYLDLPHDLLAESLNLPKRSRRAARFTARRSPFNPANCKPEIEHHIWFMRQMQRWGHLPEKANVEALAGQCIAADSYLSAMENITSGEVNHPPSYVLQGSN